MDILTNIPRIGAFVIAGEPAGTKKEKPRADLKRPWQTIIKRAGVKEARLHDLRHSFAAVRAGQEHGLPVINCMKNSSRDNIKTPKKRTPATGDLIGVRVQPGMAKALDDWRRKQDDLPGRPEAVRRLVEIGLKARRDR